MGRLLDRLVVGFVVFLITFIGYSSQMFIIWPYYGHVLSVQLLSLLLPFNVLLAMLLWNYYLCVTVDPGRVPATWKPDLHGDEGYEVKKLTRGPRYCRSCENYKPPRAHHCRQCKRCVLRMDHHCPWINNCVGHFNCGHFIRFLFYVDLACSYHIFMVTKRVMHATSTNFWDEPSTVELIFIILNYTLSIPVLIAVGCFSIYHFHALLTNTTTIEGWEKDKAATLVRKGRVQEIKFPYNVGMRRNIESVLGDRPLLWCWPTVTPGSGLKYPLSNPQDPEASSWPPNVENIHAPPDVDPNFEFTLPESPWTYNNGTLNPNLLAHNSRHPVARRRKGFAQKEGASSVPPYHPDYRPPGKEDGSDRSFGSNSSSTDDEPLVSGKGPRGLTRRGSEGYEARPIDREAMLREHVEQQIQEPGRYNVYVPDPITPNESESETEVEDVEEEVPLVRRVEEWRTTSTGVGAST